MWALGLILYRLLTSKHPFLKDNNPETIKAIRVQEPEPLPEGISATT